MSDFTFLTLMQCYGDNMLNVLQKRGTEAEITDFSILLGGNYKDFSKNSNNHIDKRIGDYWTTMNDGKYGIYINDNGEQSSESINKRNICARPVLPIESMDSIPTNGEKEKMTKDGVLEAEYGYYPQKAVSKDMQKELEREYKNGNVIKTKNSYTTDSYFGKKDVENEFKPQLHHEYEYDGKRYVRVSEDNHFGKWNNGVTLSNGEKYRKGDKVWLEVAPVKWLVDEKTHVMVAEKLMFSGVQFNENKQSSGMDFNNTNIKAFMDKYFSRDLVQSREIEKQSNASMKTEAVTMQAENDENLKGNSQITVDESKYGQIYGKSKGKIREVFGKIKSFFEGKTHDKENNDQNLDER